MPLSLLTHSARALFAQRTRIPPSARRALASVPFGFVLVRVRVRRVKSGAKNSSKATGLGGSF